MSEEKIQLLEIQIEQLKKEIAQNKKDIADLKDALTKKATSSKPWERGGPPR